VVLSNTKQFSVSVKSRKDLENNLIARCLKDETFKSNFLVNPKMVIEKELGTELPENLKIEVLEEDETHSFLVIPSNPYSEFTEEEL
jgi:hypothetical protein